jgi:hypothetical protein
MQQRINGREQVQHMLCDDFVAGRDQSGTQSPVGRSNIFVRRYPDNLTVHRHGVAARTQRVLADFHGQFDAFYSDIGRLSIDPELMKGALPM